MTTPYTKTTYVNNSAPALNAINLNKIEQGIYDADLYGSDIGGDDTYVLNLSTTLVTGLKVRIKVTTGNTGTCTLSIDNGVTTKTIRKMTSGGLVDLVTGDILAGQIVELSYDGTYWQLLGAYVYQAVNANTLDNLHAIDFVPVVTVTGTATYTDTLTASQTLTKTIPLGGIYRKGKAYIRNANNIISTAMVLDFSTDSTKTLVNSATVGIYRRDEKTRLTDPSGTPTLNYGSLFTVTPSSIVLVDMYISGTNLTIVFNNVSGTTSYALNTKLDWEVWG